MAVDQTDDESSNDGGGVYQTFKETYGDQTLVNLVFDGAEYSFAMPRTDVQVVGPKRAITVLDAAEGLGIQLPHSCCHGLCATCLASLKHGSVDHLENHMLDESALADGHILLCQAVPTSERLDIRVGADTSVELGAGEDFSS